MKEHFDQEQRFCAEPRTRAARLEGKAVAFAARSDPAPASTSSTLAVSHHANHLSGANDGPDVPKGDAVWT